MNLSSPGEMKALLEKNGFHFSKALGQNFLINPSVCPRMAEAAVPSADYGVIEVGPGVGVLTVELAKRASKVVAIELDERLFPILDETLADYPNAKVVHGDVLEVDLHKLIEEEFARVDEAGKPLKDANGDPIVDADGKPLLRPVVICANLPYYITSPVIMKLLSENLPIESLTVMVQKEAADRLCAEVGTRAAGAVTVAIQFYAEAMQLFFVSKGSFLPAPKVDSEVIQLKLRQGEKRYSLIGPGNVLPREHKQSNSTYAQTIGSNGPAGAVATTDKESCKVAETAEEKAAEQAFFKMVQAGFSQRRKTIMNSFSAALGMSKAELGALLDDLDIPRTARIEQLTMDQLMAIYKVANRGL